MNLRKWYSSITQQLLVKYLIENNIKGLKEVLSKYTNWSFLFQCIVIEEDLLITPIFALV